MSEMNVLQTRKQAADRLVVAADSLLELPVGALRRRLAVYRHRGGRQAVMRPRQAHLTLANGQGVFYALFCRRDEGGDRHDTLWISGSRNGWRNSEGHRVAFESDESGLRRAAVHPARDAKTPSLQTITEQAYPAMVPFLRRLPQHDQLSIQLDSPELKIGAISYDYDAATEVFLFSDQGHIGFSDKRTAESYPGAVSCDDFLIAARGLVALIPQANR